MESRGHPGEKRSRFSSLQRLAGRARIRATVFCSTLRRGSARRRRQYGLLALVLLVAVGSSALWAFSGLQTPVRDRPVPYYRTHKPPQVLQHYARSHARMLSRHGGGARVVLYAPPANMTSVAAPLLGLVSAFYFAVASDRALVVDWPDTIHTPVPVPVPTRNGTSSGAADDDGGDWGAWQWSPGEHVLLEELFDEPGFKWSARSHHEDKVAAWRLAAHDLDVHRDFDALFCDDPRTRFPQPVVRFSTDKYFVPLLALNAHVRERLGHDAQLPPHALFEALLNFLVRPVKPVSDAVQAISQQQMESRVVVALHIAAQETGMTAATLANFFDAAEESSHKKLRHFDPDKTGLYVLAVADKPGVFTDADSALTAHGFEGRGLPRLLDELTHLWLLGFADEIFTTPTSVFGIVAHARKSIKPTLVLSGERTYQSGTSQPCLAALGLIEESSCFVHEPGLLQEVEWDVRTPC